MCCGFTVYLNATLQKTLLAHRTTEVSGQVAIIIQLKGLSSHEWGLTDRQHIHDSFQNGAINLDDPAIAALVVSIHVAPNN
jgi:hypothetical protein